MLEYPTVCSGFF